jgi:hypothetical protein
LALELRHASSKDCFLGASAIEGLAKSHRQESGFQSGVIGIVFLAAGIAPEGYVHSRRPFMHFLLAEGKGEMWCKDPRSFSFNDLSDANAKK